MQVDGIEETVYTHRATVRDLLRDLGIQPAAQDRILPALDGAVERDMTLVVERARPVRVPVSYTHLRAHETVLDLVCRLLLEKKKSDLNTEQNSLQLQ